MPKTNDICRKLAKGSGIILRLKHFLPKKILLIIYNSLILPFISYCTIVWGNAASTHVNKLFVVQKRIFRAIDGKSHLDHSKPIFKKYNSLTVFDITKHQVAVFMFQSYHNLLPNSLSKFFCSSRSLLWYQRPFLLYHPIL